MNCCGACGQLYDRHHTCDLEPEPPIDWAVLFATLLAVVVLGGFALLAGHILDVNVHRSTDGRFHQCGLVTEQGITEHLVEYWDRCGQ